MRDIYVKESPRIVIGRYYENEVTRVLFPIEHKNMNVSMIYQREGDTAPYPVELTLEGDYAVWLVRDVDTAIAGEGKAEIWFSKDGKRGKSKIYSIIVSQTLTDPIEGTPNPYTDWYGEFAERISLIQDTERTLLEIRDYIETESGKVIDYAREAAESERKAEEYSENARESSTLAGQAAFASRLSADKAEEEAIKAEANAVIAAENKKDSDALYRLTEAAASQAKTSEAAVKKYSDQAKQAATDADQSRSKAYEYQLIAIGRSDAAKKYASDAYLYSVQAESSADLANAAAAVAETKETSIRQIAARCEKILARAEEVLEEIKNIR